MTAPAVSPASRLRQAASRVAYGAVTWVPRAGLLRAARQVPGWLMDWLLAAGFLAAMLAGQVESAPQPEARQVLSVALSVVVAGGLALRRKVPVTAYLLGTSGLVAGALWAARSTAAPYANLIGLYSVGLYARKARAWWGPVLAVAGVLGYFARAGHALPGQAPAGVLVSWLLAWTVGYGTARRREEQHAARHAMRQQAIADERSRLARELHDLVGHTVNVMVVQAGAARLVLDHDPAKTREVLASLELTGRRALTELDWMLGVLRRDRRGTPRPGDRASTATAGPPGPGVWPGEEDLTMPGIADLPQLAHRLTEAGIRVTLQINPPSPPVARSTSLSAYRIVQEALTNSVKHGHARSASVTIGLDGPALAIEVRDDGRVTAGYRPGRGLLGMAERVSAFGGSLQHGEGEQGGFRLRAVLLASSGSPATSGPPASSVLPAP
jgi:signal transduction histidine kinase